MTELSRQDGQPQTSRLDQIKLIVLIHSQITASQHTDD
jgi:hypothetical protein